MTISVPNQLLYSYQGDGATTVFAYPVRFLDQDELTVISRDQFGADTVKTLDVDYTVTGAGDAAGGSITTLWVPSADETVILYRSTEAKQIVDLKDNQKNPAEAVEQQLDRIVMVEQDHGRRLDAFEDSVDDLDASVAAAAASATAAATSETNAAASETQAGLDADRAEAAAAGVNLPSIETGDAGLALTVKPDASGYEFKPVPPTVPSRTALKALNENLIKAAYLTEDGRQGQFLPSFDDLSDLIEADTTQGVAVPFPSDASGTSGAWVRPNPALTLYLKAFGAVGDWSGDFNVADGTDDTAAFTAAFKVASALGGAIIHGEPGKCYRLTYTVFYGSNVIFEGNGCKILINVPTSVDGAAFLPENFTTFGAGGDADPGSLVENCIFRNHSIDSYKGNDWGIAYGVLGAKGVLFENIRTDWLWFHQVDGCAGKDIFIDRCSCYGSESAAWQADYANGIGSVWGIDAEGNQIVSNVDASYSSSWAWTENFHVTRCIGQHCGFAAVHIHKHMCRKIYVENNYFDNNGAGVWTDNGDSQDAAVNELFIRGNYIIRSSNGGIAVTADCLTIVIDNNYIQNDPGSTADLIGMRGEVVRSSRGVCKITNNIFRGGLKSVTVGHYTNVIVANNTFVISEASSHSVETDVRKANADGWMVNIYGAKTWVIANNNFNACGGTACAFAHGGNRSGGTVSGAFTGNVSTSGAALALLCDVDQLSVSGNSTGTQVGYCDAVVIESCDRAVVSGNALATSVSDGYPLAVINCSSATVVGNSLEGGAGYECMLIDGVSGAYTYGNTMWGGSGKIKAVDSSVHAAEPFIASSGFSHTGTGTFTYVTYTTATV